MPSRQAAIRNRCMECGAESDTSVRCCPVLDCPLWDFRMGYKTKRNELCYNREFYDRHKDVPQEEFNRILKRAQKEADGRA